jgi:hypothetical protein
VAAKIQRRPLRRFAPVEKRYAVLRRQGAGERAIGIEVENRGRIDQRRHEDKERTLAAAVAKRGSTGRCQDRSFDLRARRLRILVATKPPQRGPGEIGVARGHLGDQVKEQGQGPGTPALLRCGKRRC